VLKESSRVSKSLEQSFVEQINKKTQGSKKKKEPKPVLSLEQKYHSDVFQHLTNLIHAVERIDEIAVYLGQFPNSETFSKHGITQDKWIHYHYANYTITVIGIYDTVLLLVNAVFLLGLSPESCKDSTVTENLRVQITPVSAAIKRLNEVVKKYRQKRNLYAHRSQLPNLGFIESLESYRFIQESEKELGIETEPIMHPIIVKDLYRLERRNLVKSVNVEMNQVLEILENIFDTLQPIHSHTAEQLLTPKAA
jgi:hypothetical protein